MRQLPHAVASMVATPLITDFKQWQRAEGVGNIGGVAGVEVGVR